MSSTNRSGESFIQRKGASDYYVTPVPVILAFLKELVCVYPGALDGRILDPCAGGDADHAMSYPEALLQAGVSPMQTSTVDVREDSLAATKADYLDLHLAFQPDLIITNPPFLYAEAIARKALSDVRPGGLVCLLLRLNFFGGKARKPLWDDFMPEYAFVHSRRLSFTDDGRTDSIEYMHAVWVARPLGGYPKFTNLRVI